MLCGKEEKNCDEYLFNIFVVAGVVLICLSFGLLVYVRAWVGRTGTVKHAKFNFNCKFDFRFSLFLRVFVLLNMQIECGNGVWAFRFCSQKCFR